MNAIIKLELNCSSLLYNHVRQWFDSYLSHWPTKTNIEKLSQDNRNISIRFSSKMHTFSVVKIRMNMTAAVDHHFFRETTDILQTTFTNTFPETYFINISLKFVRTQLTMGHTGLDDGLVSNRDKSSHGRAITQPTAGNMFRRSPTTSIFCMKTNRTTSSLWIQKQPHLSQMSAAALLKSPYWCRQLETEPI